MSLYGQEVGPPGGEVLLNNQLGIKQHNTSSSPKVVKTKVVDRKKKEDDNTYNFNHKKRGIALIITNDEFDDKSLFKREGSEHDTNKLDKCFQYHGFDTRIAVNMNVYETEQYLKIVAAEINFDKDFDCFVLAISSHGELEIKVTKEKKFVSDVVHCTDGSIATNKILDLFSDENCPGLIGKPRLCFIQACRGQKLDDGVILPNNYTASIDVVDCKVDQYQGGFTNFITSTPFPCMKDFLVMYASPPGYYAFRRLKEGSWFIIALTSILESVERESQNCDLNKLLRAVIKKVAYSYESSSKNAVTNLKKQSPCIYSMLTKTVNFCPK